MCVVIFCNIFSFSTPLEFFFKSKILLLVENQNFLKDDEILTVEILEQSASDNASRQSSNQFNSIEKTEENSTPQVMKRPPIPTVNAISASVDASSDEDEVMEAAVIKEKQQVAASAVVGKRNSATGAVKHYGTKGAMPSPMGSAKSFDLQVSESDLRSS